MARKLASFRSGVPGMGSRPLSDHTDAPMTARGKRLFYGLVVFLVVLGCVGVAVAR